METTTASQKSQVPAASGLSWFRIETRIPGVRETFVDWFLASSLVDALALADTEAVANLLPDDAVQTGRIATEAEARAL